METTISSLGYIGRRVGTWCLRVQVYYILTQNQYYDYYGPQPKYLIIGYLDPLRYVRLGPKGA